MNILFCADEKVLPGLHVAAYSLLASLRTEKEPAQFFVCSETLGDADIALLRQTLAALAKPFTLTLKRLDAAALANAPRLNGSTATYYRLLAIPSLPVERLLYVDADTLCELDVSGLASLEMEKFPAAWVPEAPLNRAVDRVVAEQLGSGDHGWYFNAGIILVNVPEWRRQRVTERALDYIAAHRPSHHDQSALNIVLYRNALILDEKFNCIANMRKHWPVLRRPPGETGRLVHFVDYPKPWDFLGEFVHPHYALWRAILAKTALRDFRSWHKTAGRRWPQSRQAWLGYKKAIKDLLLFAGYAQGWLKHVKGVSSA